MYYILTLLARLIGMCPPRWLDRAAWIVAFLVFDVLRFRRRLVMENLRTVFGDSRSDLDSRRVARASIHSMFLAGFEVFHHALKGDLADTVTIVGAEFPRAALARGRGFYLLSAHTGNIDALGCAVVRNIAPAYAPAKAVGSPGVNRFVMELRRRYGLTTDSNRKKGEGSARIREAIASGAMVGFYLDQSRPGAPKFPFFNRPAKTSPSLASLWRRDPAPVIPALVHRVAPDRHEVEFFAPIDPVRTDDELADLDTNTRLFLRATENLVTRYPEQYLWMHARWKS